MTKMENDNLIHQFFDEHKQQIPDNGFSRRVMRNLPDRSNLLMKIWILFCSMVAAILFFAFGGMELIFSLFRSLFEGILATVCDINPIHLTIAVGILVLLGIHKIISID